MRWESVRSAKAFRIWGRCCARPAFLLWEMPRHGGGEQYAPASKFSAGLAARGRNHDWPDDSAARDGLLDVCTGGAGTVMPLHTWRDREGVGVYDYPIDFNALIQS